MPTDYETLIPQKVLFNINEVENIGAVKSEMMKKLIKQGYIEIVKIGNKTHISRTELIRYLNDNTIRLK